MIRRPAEALAAIGRHPNLLQILDFNRLDEENEFYEITEWSDFGTLHGYLSNSERDKLTLRERLEIAVGVANALEAVHARGLVHRNVCPETILIDADRVPRLTDFDRAYLARGQTVFAATQSRTKNPAYVPPELEDVTNYRFDASSDMYSFGVLLYELLTDHVPFAGPRTARGGAREAGPDALGGPRRRRPAARRPRPPPAGRRRPPTTPVGLATVLTLRELLGSTHVTERPGRATLSTSTGRSRPPFEEGTILNGIYRVDDRLGTGAFSQVLKVYHLDQAQDLRDEAADGRGRRADHARRVQPDREPPACAPQHRRDEVDGPARPALNTMYILSEYVDGETLIPYCKGEKKLAWTDIRGIGSALLDALDVMHPKTREFEVSAQNSRRGGCILHRDIKPANILLELPSHRPKLIDFNIASHLLHATGQGGTPRYWAPDRGRPDWRPDMDLFSLGVVLYELVTQRHPFPENNDPTARGRRSTPPGWTVRAGPKPPARAVAGTSC